MLQGYFLRGINDENIIVFKSDDDEDILRIISRLAATRDKEIKGLAQKMEISYYERQKEKDDKVRRYSKHPRTKNSSPGENGG